MLGLCVEIGLKPFLIFDLRTTLNTVNMMIMTIAANKRTASMTIPASSPFLLTSALRLIVGDSNSSVLGDSKNSSQHKRTVKSNTMTHMHVGFSINTVTVYNYYLN